MSAERSSLPAPHGGALVDRFVAAADVDAFSKRAASLPHITLDARERSDVEIIAVGAASPLTGFLGKADYDSVVEHMRLKNGTVWPLPYTLAVDDATAAQLKVGGEAGLYDENGRLWGTIAVSEIFTRDPLVESRHVYGTEDASHPGVAYLLQRPKTLVGGDIRVLPLPEDLPFAAHRYTPRALRAEIERRGWKSTAGFQTRNPIHRAHEYLTKLALEVTDGLVIHPLVGETKNDDVPAAVRFEAYETLIANYYPKDRTLLAAFPAAMRYAGPREALFHAIARKNYGIDRLIVGRDHAGVGKFYGPYDAQAIFDKFAPEDLSVVPLKLEPTFYCTSCGTLASTRTCPHDVASRLELSGTRVREILREGGRLPSEFTRPEVAEVLRRYYGGKRRATQPVATPSDQRPSGAIVWFTGLSGAGKSTLANALRDEIESERAVEILDGDEVRTFLSKGLGFSKEDRDTNVQRIGYVARLLARTGTLVITAAISPYAETRNDVRRQAEALGLQFIEVYIQAELSVLVERDVKGLYKKAIAGEIAHFTGVSDPYEPPVRPDLTVHSDKETVDASLNRLVAVLADRGLVNERAVEAQVS
jgi:sulfate adenylyltransferase